MKKAHAFPALDAFRLAAALLVLCIHTSPLAGISQTADFLLTRVLARLAVPFFFMASGHFLALGGKASRRRYMQRTALLYGLSILLYLPLNLYSGALSFPESLWALLFQGTFYHLWYLPAALLGMPLAFALRRLGRPLALSIAGLLYLFGLFGDSYYGFLAPFPALEAFYAPLFQIFGYSRCGLFFAPLFFLLGAEARAIKPKYSLPAFLLVFCGMGAEGLWLRGLGVQRHDSMYLLLPLCAYLLFSLLLAGNRGRSGLCRDFSVSLYLLHPWCIVLVRGLGKLLGLEALLIHSPLVHFSAVLGLTLLLCLALYILRPRRRDKRGRAWRELDLEALRHNADLLSAALAPGCRLMAVVKAEAYGHGAVPVARALQKHGIRAFAVATLAEGIALRRAGIRGLILILGWTDPAQAGFLARFRLCQAVADLEHGLQLAAQKRRIHVHLALDTGMHRLGIPAGDRAALARLYGEKKLQIDGLFSHLCLSDSLKAEDFAYTNRQLEAFYDTAAWLRSQGLRPGALHIQASYGILNLPAQPCAYARAGIALYGVYICRGTVQRRLELRPVLSLRARVTSVRQLEAGEGAGYGLAFKTQEKTRLAVLSIGYADGLPRDFAQRGGEVLIRGQRLPVVGLVCMDQMLVDASALPALQAGEVATLIGRDGQEEIHAEDVAAQCGSISNELLSRLGSRLETVTAVS